MMVVRKCDICGRVIHKTTPNYRVLFDGWLYTERKDICVSCFERIREEIKQANTPQAEVKKRIIKPIRAVWLDDDHNEIGDTQTEQSNRSTAEFITGTQIGDPQPLPNSITTWASTNTPQTERNKR